RRPPIPRPWADPSSGTPRVTRMTAMRRAAAPPSRCSPGSRRARRRPPIRPEPARNAAGTPAGPRPDGIPGPGPGRTAPRRGKMWAVSEPGNLRGQLLVAGAGLWDPNFRRTVVLIGEHNDEGAVGVVLNRPLAVSVGEAVPPLVDLAGADEPVFLGGPV